MQIQHPAIARAAALKVKLHAHAPQAAESAVPIGIQLGNRLYELRNSIAIASREIADPFLDPKVIDLRPQFRQQIREELDEIEVVEAQIQALETEATARKSYYSNTAYRIDADVEYYGRGYVSARGKNYRSCHIWRVGQPDQPVDECNDRYEGNDEGGDLFYDEDGEPRFVALCESAAMATALCALLNRDDFDFMPTPKNECAD